MISLLTDFQFQVRIYYDLMNNLKMRIWCIGLSKNMILHIKKQEFINTVTIQQKMSQFKQIFLEEITDQFQRKNQSILSMKYIFQAHERTLNNIWVGIWSGLKFSICAILHQTFNIISVHSTFSDLSMYSQESPQSLEKTSDTFEEIKSFGLKKCQSTQMFYKPDEDSFSQRYDEYRSPHSYKDGGFICKDDKQIDKLRSVGKEMIKLVGRKILSGELNVTKISFPIKACAARTALQNSIESCVIFPHFLNRAAACEDPLERFKLSCAAILCSSSYVDMFLKPLNPIIGETLQGQLEDGTKLYCQQISHHPPISYFLVYGPDNCYQFSGYYNFDISPGLNSLTLKNKGQRRFTFRDGTQIVATYASGVFSNTFIGTTRIEEAGECEIVDHRNGFRLVVEFGKMKKKPSDYFRSFIKKDGKQVSEVFGTYCGFIEFDKKRYWDLRDFQPLQIDYNHIGEPKLPSSFDNRKDLKLLSENKMMEAQDAKDELEHIQRTDEKHRKKNKAHTKETH